MVEFFAPILAAVFLALAFVWMYADIEAGGDEYGIGREYDLSHLWNARERGVALGMAAVSFHAKELMEGLQWPPLALFITLLQCGLLFAVFAVAFWVAFDVRLNLRRGKEWSYLGSTAGLDKMARSFYRSASPGMAFLLTKIILFTLSLSFYLGATWLRHVA
jgi:hypothetical protein